MGLLWLVNVNVLSGKRVRSKVTNQRGLQHTGLVAQFRQE